MTVVQLLIALIWTFLFQQIYRILFPPRRMLLVCGDRPAFHLMEKIHSREDKYYLETAIHIRVGMKAILEEAKKLRRSDHRRYSGEGSKCAFKEMF